MECAAMGNESFGIELDFTAPKEFSSEDDEEALRRIFDSCPVAIPVEKSCPVAIPVEKSCPAAAFVEKGCPVTGSVEMSCPVASPVEKNYDVSGVKVNEAETGVAAESGEVCNVVEVDAEAAVQALILPQAVKETVNVCLDEVDGSNIDVVEVANEFNVNKLEGAKEKLVPTSNHPDALGREETVDMEESPEEPQMAGEKLDELNTNNLDEVGSGDEGEAFDDASNGENVVITEIFDIELMKGKPLEKSEEIPDEEDNLIVNASPSSPHDGEPASVEIVTDESYEDWESVSFGDWESVCHSSSVEEVNNNTVALTVESNEYQKKIPSGNRLCRYASEKYDEEFSKKPVGDEGEFSKKPGGDEGELSKKPVGDDEL